MSKSKKFYERITELQVGQGILVVVCAILMFGLLVSMGYNIMLLSRIDQAQQAMPIRVVPGVEKARIYYPGEENKTIGLLTLSWIRLLHNYGPLSIDENYKHLETFLSKRFRDELGNFFTLEARRITNSSITSTVRNQKIVEVKKIDDNTYEVKMFVKIERSVLYSKDNAEVTNFAFVATVNRIDQRPGNEFGFELDNLKKKAVK